MAHAGHVLQVLVLFVRTPRAPRERPELGVLVWAPRLPRECERADGKASR